MPAALPPSVLYPCRVFFFAQKPDDLLDAGYDSLRIEKRKNCDSAWKPVKPDFPCEIKLESGRYNYQYLDEKAERGNEYRAILQNSATPGTPVDIPQPTVQGVDVAYEQVLTINELKDKYLWGQEAGFITDDGRTQPDYTFVMDIQYGIKKVERKLDIKLLPTRIVETHDWVPESLGKGWLQLVLDQFPVIQVESLTLKMPGSPDYEFPVEWLRVTKDTGMVNVLPAGPPTTGFSPRVRGYVPDALEVVYWAGFRPGEIPGDLREVVGKEASFGPLNVGGDLIGGAGLAGTSLSLDGLSQSVTTTNSSTNAGFGARLIQYEKELRETYKTLLRYYKGLRMQVA